MTKPIYKMNITKGTCGTSWAGGVVDPGFVDPGPRGPKKGASRTRDFVDPGPCGHEPVRIVPMTIVEQRGGN
jgi:hypothetical protein